jgi:GTP-binding protein EngB required for normal cell division
MNESHQRHLVTTFRYIDELLGEAARILATADSASPFAKYTQDSSPVQRKVVDDHIGGISQAMTRIMAELDLPRPAPICGALWAAQTEVSSARIAVAEIRPQAMRGYGALSEADVARIDGIVAELDAALERLTTYLAQGPDADLPARLQKLEQTRDEVPLLRELERIVTAHGLVGLRGTLAMLLDRMDGDSFEIGVFGRVSSGKSSLLNHLLGTAVLPVGVTPVTAVPTRIRSGENTRATIEFAQSPPITVGLERLSEFSSEQQNPGNHKHVTRIVVEVQAARLRQGITWVDTPGLGSLATDGAAETTAYLPRCDLGLVLIDAGATLTQEDQALVQLLLRSGAGAMVLVSKADLLEASDRQRFVEYVQQQLASQFGTVLPVYPVSVVGGAAALCDAWFEQALQPLLLAHREQAAAALKRKVGLLREAVSRTLEARLGKPSALAAPETERRSAESIAVLRAGDGLCAATRHAAEALVDALPSLADPMIDAAANETLAQWRQARSTADVVAVCAAIVQRSTIAHTAGIVRLLAELRRQLEDTLRQGRQTLGLPAIDGEPLPSPSGMPQIDATAAVRALKLPLPGWLSMLPASWAIHLVRARLHEQWHGPLADGLDHYQRNLRFWLRQAIADSCAGFQAHAAPLMTQLEARTTSGSRDTLHEIEADLARLREFASLASDPQ